MKPASSTTSERVLEKSSEQTKGIKTWDQYARTKGPMGNYSGANRTHLKLE
jgi:hypothetical protein